MSTPDPNRLDPKRYAALIEREARHWSTVDCDPQNPQLWDDPEIYARVLEPAYRHLLERARAAGSPLLELGCGDGELALELARSGMDVVGVDLSPERIARAREHARELGLEARARFEVADLNVAALPGEAFAGVVAHDALHHVLHLGSLLDRVSQGLRPGGRLLVSDFRGASALEKLVTSAIVAVLPTHMSYRRKWALRGRVRALLAPERSKRAALGSADAGALHDASPFEAISQESIEPLVRARFDVLERFSYCPFWYRAVPMLRIPRAWQRALLAAAQRVDRPLHARGWTQGAYVFLEARKRS